MRVLVTGANGFVDFSITKRDDFDAPARESGAEIIGMSLPFLNGLLGAPVGQDADADRLNSIVLGMGCTGQEQDKQKSEKAANDGGHPIHDGRISFW